MDNKMLSGVKVATVLAPAADVFAGTVNTAAISLSNYSDASFVITKGVGATGTSTITVEKCSASDGTGAEAIPFLYQRIQGDTRGDMVWATAAGFTTVAGSSESYLVHVSTQLEGMAEGDKPWVRLKAVEVVDSPVAGSVVALVSGGRYGTDVGPTVLA